MIVCKDCGFNNADADAFCGSCGSFLEWSGEKVAKPAPVVEAEEPKRKQSLLERVNKVIYFDVGEAKPTGGDANAATGPAGAPGGASRPPGAPSGPGGPPAGPGGAPRPPMPGGPGGGPRPPMPGGPGGGPGGAPRPPMPGGPPRPPAPGAPPSGPPARPGPPSGPPARPAAPAAPPSGPPARPAAPAAPAAPPPPALPPRPAPPAAPPPPALPPRPAPPAAPPAVASSGAVVPQRPAPPPRPPAPAAPTSGPASEHARDIAAALVAKAPEQSTNAADGPSLPPRPAPPAAVAAAQPAPSQPEAIQPQAMQPQAADKKRPPKVAPTKPTRTAQPGDLICGDCGEVNVAGRRFCSRCGTSLAEATTFKRAWWRKLLPRRRPKGAMAGERPWEAKDGAKKKPKRHGFAKVIVPLRRVVSIALVLGGIVYSIHEPTRTKVNDVYSDAKGKVMSVIKPQYEQVRVGPGTVSNDKPEFEFAAEHPGILAVDGFKNTEWRAQPLVLGHRPELRVQLVETADLARIIVHNGSSVDYAKFDRPKILLFVFDNGQEYRAELSDKPDRQEVKLENAQGVKEFRIAVEDVYHSLDGSGVALTEIEFFRKE